MQTHAGNGFHSELARHLGCCREEDALNFWASPGLCPPPDPAARFGVGGLGGLGGGSPGDALWGSVQQGLGLRNGVNAGSP